MSNPRLPVFLERAHSPRYEQSLPVFLISMHDLQNIVSVAFSLPLTRFSATFRAYSASSGKSLRRVRPPALAEVTYWLTDDWVIPSRRATSVCLSPCSAIRQRTTAALIAGRILLTTTSHGGFIGSCHERFLYKYNAVISGADLYCRDEMHSILSIHSHILPEKP